MHWHTHFQIESKFVKMIQYYISIAKSYCTFMDKNGPAKRYHMSCILNYENPTSVTVLDGNFTWDIFSQNLTY